MGNGHGWKATFAKAGVTGSNPVWGTGVSAGRCLIGELPTAVGTLTAPLCSWLASTRNASRDTLLLAPIWVSVQSSQITRRS